MCVPMAYIVGNFLTSHWVRDKGERRVMQIGQAAAVSGLALLLVLGFAGLKTPLAFSLPLILLGLGHGLLVPPSISGTVGLIPALAGAAAAAAGLVQQLMGAFGGYAVGLMPHDGAVNLGLLMMGFTLCALAAQWMLHRR
jgi:DHA1 family bicyclomycin/chloramphenicol resistance-like MFS transporter